jgi:hypothetical protein
MADVKDREEIQMDYTIGGTFPISRDLPKKRDYIPRVKKSGSRQERRKKKKDPRRPREEVVVRLSSGRDRNASDTHTYSKA